MLIAFAGTGLAGQRSGNAAYGAASRGLHSRRRSLILFSLGLFAPLHKYEHRRQQPQQDAAAVPTLANGKICYVELPASDVHRSAEFYRKSFGWRIRQRGDGSIAFDDGVGEVSATWVLGIRSARMAPQP